MNRVAKFEKVSFEQFSDAWKDTFGDEENISQIYDAINLPKRATSGSAGYDFYAPCDINLKPGETMKVPTGVRVKIDDGWFLAIYPRSGLGFKYRLQLDNTVGIIDSDYYYSDNEGHMFIKITNDSKSEKILSVGRRQGFAQGIFTPYGITVDDDTDTVRNGGFGSTTK